MGATRVGSDFSGATFWERLLGATFWERLFGSDFWERLFLLERFSYLNSSQNLYAAADPTASP